MRVRTRDPKKFRHHDVADLTLLTQTFDVRSAPGQQLVIYQAEPGSASAQALTLLGTLAATAGPGRDRLRNASS